MVIVLESLNNALHQALQQSERVILLGEDILDPYGGAFKVTRGLSSSYPERVLTTPISEAGILGVATGMALRGLLPVVEIMFGDFLSLVADQIINHAAKFSWMYSGGKPPEKQVTVPVVLRTPMGGRRGYGPTHSQTLEKHFLGVPGLRVLAPCALGDPGALLLNAIFQDKDPVLFIENKLLYLQKIINPEQSLEFKIEAAKSPPDSTHPLLTKGLEETYAPTFRLTLRGAPPPKVTIVAYGYMAELAQQALLRLAYEYEIFAELIVPTQLSPYILQPIFDSVCMTNKLLTVEEGTYTLGWGAEIIARAAQTPGLSLQVASRLAGMDLPVPASQPLEFAVLPQVADIVQTVRKMV